MHLLSHSWWVVYCYYPDYFMLGQIGNVNGLSALLAPLYPPQTVPHVSLEVGGGDQLRAVRADLEFVLEVLFHWRY